MSTDNFNGLSATDTDTEKAPDGNKIRKSKNQIFYTKAEELFNIFSHMAGAVLSVAATILCIVKASVNAGRGVYEHPAIVIVSVCLYGLSIILMYLMSCLYHSRKSGSTARLVFRRFDHCMISLLIAGTYAPFMLIGLAGSGNKTDFIWAVAIASVVLAVAILTVVFNAVNVHKFRYFSMAAYVIMGWCCAIRIYQVYLAIGLQCFLYLILGGVVYTLGIIFYSFKKIKFNHAIWHLFVMAGSVLHFIAIYFYLL